jgi:hypothetical protein
LAVVVLLLLLVVVEALLVDTTFPTPTQYELPTQKFLAQSADTSGFHFKNCSGVMLNFFSTVSHPSPLTTVYHALQFATVFGNVGPVGEESCAETGPSPAATRTAAVNARMVDRCFDEAIVNMANKNRATGEEDGMKRKKALPQQSAVSISSVAAICTSRSC